MIAELDLVELVEAFEAIPAGTQGTVLMVFDGAYEVEFPELARETFAVPADRVKLVWSASHA